MQVHAEPVFAPVQIQENDPGELFMYWFRARGTFAEILLGPICALLTDLFGPLEPLNRAGGAMYHE